MRLSPLAPAVAAVLASITLLAGATPAAAAPSASEVGKVFGRFDTLKAPGCAVAVDLGGRTVFEAGYGAANLEFAVPVTPDTAFDIGSTSKQFTAALILLLAQDGKLSLDDDVRKYLPELPDYGRPITVRHILNHTSGLRDFVTLLMFADIEFDDISTASQAMDILARQRGLNFPTGDRYQYSNSGYFLAGQIVERVSGKSVRDFAQERLFGPLKMTRTRYRDRHDEVIDRYASGYSPDETERGAWRIDRPNWEQVGDGGIVSTVGDLLIWNRNFRTGIVGGRDFAARMEETGVLNDWKATNYAKGLMVDDHDGLRMVHHGGSWGGYRAEVVRFPGQALSVATLCNSSQADASALAIETADLWLPKAPAPPPVAVKTAVPPTAAMVEVAPAILATWAGVYRNPDSGSQRTVEITDSGLGIVAFGGRYGLAPTASDQFRLVDGPFEASFRFTAATATQPRRLTQFAMERSVEFQAIELAHPTAAEVAAYAGDYDCGELGKVYRLEATNGSLTRRDGRGGVWTFDALDRDAFGYGNLTMRFERAASGRVESAVMDIGRVRNLTCKRL